MITWIPGHSPRDAYLGSQCPHWQQARLKESISEISSLRDPKSVQSIGSPTRGLSVFPARQGKGIEVYTAAKLGVGGKENTMRLFGWDTSQKL